MGSIRDMATVRPSGRAEAHVLTARSVPISWTLRAKARSMTTLIFSPGRFDDRRRFLRRDSSSSYAILENVSPNANENGAADFDFIIGDWTVRHRRLKERLVGCTEWVGFEGTSRTQKILAGHGNVEDNLLALPDGPYRAAAIRSFNSITGQWSIWWLDQRNPGQLDTPVVGRFSNGKGLFYSDDNLNGRPIKVRFTWLPKDQNSAHWEQAFSGDDGKNWETNWTMEFSRVHC